MLITNDRMRDHVAEFAESTLFRRWYGGHVVNYNILTREDGREEIRFSPPDRYGNEIQGNDCSAMETLGGNGSNGNECKCSGKAWHFPVKGWGLYERFVVRIPTLNHARE